MSLILAFLAALTLTASQSASVGAVLDRARGLDIEALLQAPATYSAPATVPVRRATIVTPDDLAGGPALAADDLAAFFERTTGQAPIRVRVASGSAPAFPPEAAGSAIVFFGVRPPAGRSPIAAFARPTRPEGYALSASTVRIGAQDAPAVAIAGSDILGLQYGAYRLLELAGVRFYADLDTFQPALARIPTAGYQETYAPPDRMRVRGFAPHLYHPVPLSIAFHDPSDEHLARVKRYLDWCVRNRQNYVQFPLLDRDMVSTVVPIAMGDAWFKRWLPHARRIVDYGHSRGLQMSINPTYAEYVSANVFAIHPVRAVWQSSVLENLRGDALRYREQLHDFANEDGIAIRALIDRLMQVPWDEICWNLGTSEFTPTNDDLTMRWMNTTARYLRRKYPKCRTTVNCHVPSHPFSEKYGVPYFDLVRYADPGVGQFVHSTQFYAFTDVANVYGNRTFEHRIPQLALADPKRLSVYYPETSYWVNFDVSVPLFLPVYMLSRRADLAMLEPVRLDGHVTFTTAWEWGYWLNDYVLARLQADPERSLPGVLAETLAPFEEARDEVVALLGAAIRDQRDFLIKRGLIRHLMGFEALTDFGAWASRNGLLPSANSTPVRLKVADIQEWGADKLAEFERTELADLAAAQAAFDALASRSAAIGVPEGARPYMAEIRDGLEINALRARQAHAAMGAAVLARKTALTGDRQWRMRGEILVAEARVAVAKAKGVIARREQAYRDGPDYTYARGPTGTLWPDRYLTKVHTAEYWMRLQDEIEAVYR